MKTIINKVSNCFFPSNFIFLNVSSHGSSEQHRSQPGHERSDHRHGLQATAGKTPALPSLSLTPVWSEVKWSDLRPSPSPSYDDNNQHWWGLLQWKITKQEHQSDTENCWYKWEIIEFNKFFESQNMNLYLSRLYPVLQIHTWGESHLSQILCHHRFSLESQATDWLWCWNFSELNKVVCQEL